MDKFRQLLDSMLKITESYKISEGAKENALVQLDVYIKHLLWYYENEGNIEKQNNAFGTMLSTLKVIEKQINKIEGKGTNKIEEIEVRLPSAFTNGLNRFEKSYDQKLKNKKSLDLLQKSGSGSFTLRDLGMEIVYFTKREIKLYLHKEWL